MPRVQFEKNTIHHSTIGITPYEALFHHKPSFGLSDLGIPSEIASDIHTEQDLECVIDEINAAAADDSEMMPDASSDNEYPPHVTSQTFPIIDLLRALRTNIIFFSSPRFLSRSVFDSLLNLLQITHVFYSIYLRQDFLLESDQLVLMQCVHRQKAPNNARSVPHVQLSGKRSRFTVEGRVNC